MQDLTRRSILKNTLATTGSLLFAGSAVASSCILTPAQTEGPFYPVEDQPDKDNDLTQVKGSTQKAFGEVVLLHGVVHDQNCQPVQGVMVEIWQACASGKYNHPGDPNPAPLDPHFQYWGRAITNDKGEYGFKTIRPGQYQATRDWIRPAHIHMKVHRRGFEEVTTQVYFADDVLNGDDRILQSLSREDKNAVIVDFKSVTGPKLGRFDITIRNF